MRVAPSLFALAVVALWSVGVHAQSAAPTPVPSPPVDAPVPAGPGALVGKSVEDLASGRVGAAVKDDVTALQRGPLLVHGNYCGLGNRPGTAPTDALDAACMRHDACTVDGELPKCRCDEGLYRDAERVAQDPQTPADLKVTAGAVATSMSLLICK